MTKVQKCSRCGRRYRENHGDWNMVLEDGRIVAIVCPECQTAEENAEAVINEATLDYVGMDEQGRGVAKPKGT